MQMPQQHMGVEWHFQNDTRLGLLLEIRINIMGRLRVLATQIPPNVYPC